MHLGDADPLRDLGLGEVLDEAQVKDGAVPLGQLVQRLRDRGAVLDGVEPGIGAAEPLGQRDSSPSSLWVCASSDIA